MQYIRSTPNPSGAYPAPQSNPFPGCLPLTDGQAAVLIQYNGFVTITQKPDEEIEGSSVMVTPDLEAWEAWKASQPTEPDPGTDPEPSGEYVTYSELAAAIREGVNLV